MNGILTDHRCLDLLSLVFYHVELKQSTAMEQERFARLSLSPAIRNIRLSLVLQRNGISLLFQQFSSSMFCFYIFREHVKKFVHNYTLQQIQTNGWLVYPPSALAEPQGKLNIRHNENRIIT